MGKCYSIDIRDYKCDITWHCMVWCVDMKKGDMSNRFLGEVKIVRE